jgi:hypothetical protein
MKQRTGTRAATDTVLSATADIHRNATDDPATDERKATLVKVEEFARDARTPMPVNEWPLGH